MMDQSENKKPNLDCVRGLDFIYVAFHGQKIAFTCERDS